MDRKCLLAVFAHPDDESFGVGGVVRTYSDAGIMTALLCATRGEAGEISDPALASRETLGAVREAELRDACRIMGFQDLVFMDYRDGELSQAPQAEAVGKVVRAIRRLRPQVVVTFDANGGYGHTDHIAIHHQTRLAFRQAGDAAAYPEQLAEGLLPYAPQKLYYTAFARSVAVQIRSAMQAQGGDFRPGGTVATIPVEEMGTPDDRISTRIVLDDRGYEAKTRAWQAHRTQASTGSFLDRLPPELMRSLRGVETYVRAVPAWEPGDAVEGDLFEEVQL